MISDPPEPYKIPRELERRPPRSVRRRPGTLGCSVVIARVIALVFLSVGIALLVMVPITIAVVTRGESHPGQVQKTWISRGRRGSSYHVRYYYEAGGQVHTASRAVSRSQYDQLTSSPTSLPLDVRAMPISGVYFEQMFLPGESQSGPIWFAIAAAVISNGLAFLLIYYIWIIPAGHKRLCRYGKPILGHIVKMHSKSGKTTTYYLDYQFDHPGLGDRTATLTVQPDRWHQAQVGEPVTVLCYPNRKRPTLIYEYGDFECG